MKPSLRFAAAALAASLLLGGTAVSAIANEAPTSPPVQQGNVEPDIEMLTQEVQLLGYPELSDHPGPSTTPLGTTRGFPEDVFRAAEPMAGGEWRMIYTQRVADRWPDFYWIPESSVALSQPAGTAEKASELAAAATGIAYKKHLSQFSGTGTIKTGASWYSSEDASTDPIATADGLGFRTATTDPAGQTWVKVDAKEGETGTTGYVLAADIVNYEPTPAEEPAQETSSSPTPEDNPAANNTTTQPTEAAAASAADGPDNIWPVIGGGLAVMVTGGGFLYWQGKRRGVVVGGAEEVSAEWAALEAEQGQRN